MIKIPETIEMEETANDDLNIVKDDSAFNIPEYQKGGHEIKIQEMQDEKGENEIENKEGTDHDNIEKVEECSEIEPVEHSKENEENFPLRRK